MDRDGRLQAFVSQTGADPSTARQILEGQYRKLTKFGYISIDKTSDLQNVII